MLGVACVIICSVSMHTAFMHNANAMCVFGTCMCVAFVSCRKIQQQSTPHTIWVDNFSKIYGHQIPSMHQGQYTNGNWTGVAIQKYAGSANVSMKCMFKRNQLIPAMPSRLLLRGKDVRQLLEVVESTMTDGNYLKSSLCERLDIRNLPLKPVVDRILNPEQHERLQKSNDGAVNLYPVEINQFNIGSNRGMLQVILKLAQDYGSQDDHKYTDHEDMTYAYVNSDVNIFYRCLKVS